MTKEKLCIIKEKDGNSYYYGGGMYGSDLFRAIYDYNKLPENEKNSYNDVIIFLDTKKGLEFLVDELHKLQNYVDNTEPRLKEVKNGLDKIYKMDIIKEYVKEYNLRVHPVIGISSETKKKIIEDIVNSSK